jgi:hypothetical protein
MSRHATLAVLALALALGGCAASQPPARLEPRSPLELRQVQTRAFDTTDDQLVLRAALDALQDEGYVIREADADLGLVTGIMEWQSRAPNQGLRVLKWVAAIPTYGASLLLPTGRHEFSAVEANVHVTREAARTRVRVSLVERVTEKNGAVRSVRPVEDPLAYQALLARLDKAVFLQKEGI